MSSTEMKRILFALCVVCALQVACAAPSDKLDCSKIDEVIDDLGGAQGLTTLNDKYKLATTSEEWAKRCKEMEEAIKTLRRYNKECFTSLTQQVFSAILRTRLQTNEPYCKPDTPEFKAAVDGVKCIAEKALEPLKEVERKAIITPQVLLEANVADDKLRTRRSCCSVVEARNDFINATKAKCAEHEKLYTEYVDSYTSEAMSLICPEADKLECGKLEVIKSDGAQPKSKFFLNPMLKMVKTLDH